METNNSSNNKNQPATVKNKGVKVNRKNKGTGMSSEGGSNQTEESWQGVNGGTMSNAQLKSKNQGSGQNEKKKNNN